LHGFDAVDYGLNLEKHAGTTAEGAVVDSGVFVASPLSYIMSMDLDQPRSDGF
jgi:hypothetical protein